MVEWNYEVAENLKVPYYEKHVFSGLYIYKLVLPEPANSQNEENKWFLHGLCSPPTGNKELQQAVQNLLLSLRNERSHYHRPAFTLVKDQSQPYGRGFIVFTVAYESGEVSCQQTQLSLAVSR